jgi:hypothetical protein
MMNRKEAYKLDEGSAWVDYDEDSACWGVFGTESAFCYSLHAGVDEANEAKEQFEAEYRRIKKKQWKTVDDRDVVLSWECPHCKNTVDVWPDYFEENGTPVCENAFCDCETDMKYTGTRVRLFDDSEMLCDWLEEQESDFGLEQNLD